MIVSVIIPVYNAQKTLARCLDSLVMQTFKDFEIILINDGSTDDCLTICELYVKADSRFNVISQKNGGVSSARNRGIGEACGDYICFIDSDDSVEVDYLENLLVDSITQNSLVMQGFKRISCTGVNVESIVFPNRLITKGDFLSLFSTYDICSYGFTCSKLFSRNIVISNGILFAEQICFSEDLLFLLEYLRHIDFIIFTSDVKYSYYINQGSLSSKISNFELEQMGLNLFLDKMQFLSLFFSVPFDELLFYSRRSVSLFIDRIFLSIFFTFEDSKVCRIDCLRNINVKYQNQIFNVYDPLDPFHCFLKQTMKTRSYSTSDYIIRIFLRLKKLKNLIK